MTFNVSSNYRHNGICAINSKHFVYNKRALITNKSKTEIELERLGSVHA
jgi:hypothetical protein